MLDWFRAAVILHHRGKFRAADALHHRGRACWAHPRPDCAPTTPEMACSTLWLSTSYRRSVALSVSKQCSALGAVRGGRRDLAELFLAKTAMERAGVRMRQVK